MDKKDKVIDITEKVRSADKVADNQSLPVSKHVTNPIMKKQLIVSVKNNVHKFSVADLFD
jgi:hypothetical protein